MLPSAKSLTVAPEILGPGIKPDLWIRTAAGPQIGFGHLKRCFILGELLKDCSTPIVLLEQDDLWTKRQLEENGWLCCLGFEDAWTLMPDPAGILIDTRLPSGLDRLISTAKFRGIPVVSIHDLGLNLLDSDIVIDGSILPPCDDDLPPNAECYIGTEYMVLGSFYGGLHQLKKPVRNTIRSIYVNLGGGNSEKYFPKVLEGLRLWSQEAEVVGVPGFVPWGQENLCGRDWHPLHFRWASSNIEQILFEADLAITAGGISAYEALCTGTPLLSLSYDPLQQATISALAGKGACVSLGPGDALDPLRLSETLSTVNSDLDMRKSLSIRGRQLVDGKGARRVAQIIRRALGGSSAVGFRGQASLRMG
jgi:spore coat polysaccharide biosynthesis predicted glycosyltransferase SpsG